MDDPELPKCLADVLGRVGLARTARISTAEAPWHRRGDLHERQRTADAFPIERASVTPRVPHQSTPRPEPRKHRDHSAPGQRREWGVAACRPGSVPSHARDDGHPSRAAVPTASCGLPASIGRAALKRSRRPAKGPSDLAPGGVYLAVVVTCDAGGLLHHPFTLTLQPKLEGGLLSVALSRGSPRVGVTDHPAVWSPDLPHRAAKTRRDRPADSPGLRVQRSRLTFVGAESSAPIRCRTLGAEPGQRDGAGTTCRHAEDEGVALAAAPAEGGRPGSAAAAAQLQGEGEGTGGRRSSRPGGRARWRRR